MGGGQSGSESKKYNSDFLFASKKALESTSVDITKFSHPVSKFHQPTSAASVAATQAKVGSSTRVGGKHTGVDAEGAYREHIDTGLTQRDVLLEHYQPAEFPLIPVITRDTNKLTWASWQLLTGREYDDPNAAGGKAKGAIFFYTTFFRMLFEKSPDFKNRFSTIQSQVSVMSKVIALCLSVDIEKLDLQRRQLVDLGVKHRRIVHDPWQYSIYAVNVLSTLQICLGDDATEQVMSAWMHVLAFVLRSMLPYAITDDHIRYYAGDTKATTFMNEKDQEAARQANDVMSLRARMKGEASVGGGGTTDSTRRGSKSDLNIPMAEDNKHMEKTKIAPPTSSSSPPSQQVSIQSQPKSARTPGGKLSKNGGVRPPIISTPKTASIAEQPVLAPGSSSVVIPPSPPLDRPTGGTQ